MRVFPFVVSLATLAALAALANAQVPRGFLVAGHRTGGAGPGIVIVDLALGNTTTTVVSTDAGATLNEILTFALDPADPTTIYANGATGGFLGGDVWPLLMTGSRHPKAVSWRPTGMPGFAFPKQFHVLGGSIFMTISGGSNNGLYEIDIAAQTVTKLPVAVPNFAFDVTSIGGKVYVVADDTTSTIVEWDTVAQAGRVVGSTYPNLKGLAAYNGQLLAGTTTGALLWIDPANGAVLATLPTGLAGSINQIATTGAAGSPVYFAIDIAGSHEVYSNANLTTPLYTSTDAISELQLGDFDVASALFYGAGCNNGMGQPLTTEHVNMAAVGNASFTMRTGNAPAGAACTVLIGRARTDIDLGVISMVGCSLYTTADLSAGATANGSGTAEVIASIPNDPLIKGSRIVTQWAALDAAANAIGIISSDAVEWVVR